MIGVIENQAPTRHLRLPVEVQEGEVQRRYSARPGQGCPGRTPPGHRRGAGRAGAWLWFHEPCAVATTVAHDSHHMIVVGTDDASMAAGCQSPGADGRRAGGRSAREVIGEVDLPIAGLISNDRAETVAQKAETVLEGFRACGCALNNPNMQLSLLGLVVIPDLRISDKGLVDVNHFRILPVFE